MSIHSPHGSEPLPHSLFAVEAPRPQDDIGLALGSAFPSTGSLPADMMAMLAKLDCVGKGRSSPG